MTAWTSPWYRLWVFGGLVAVVGGSVALGLANPTDQRVIFAILPMIAVYVGGILILQARAAGGGVERSRIRLTAVLMALILVGVGLLYAGVDEAVRPFGEAGPGFPLVFLPTFAAIAVAVLRIPFTIRQSVAEADAQLEPLGLRIIATPKVGVRPHFGGSGMRAATSGPTVIEGTRAGRRVRIELHAKEYETCLAVPTPRFTVKSDNGRLTATGRVPAAVRAALEPLGAEARWHGVDARGGADGIVVRRRVGVRHATQTLWKDDLWLAERLADAVDPRPPD